MREFRILTAQSSLLMGYAGSKEGSSIATTINLQKEFFIDGQFRAIFWLTQNEIMDLAHHAPDFWVHRNCAIEFSESPKTEQILQRTLESAWQGIGENAGPFEDIDAKISLRETLLAKLPEEEEKISTLAHSLLTLGILNWRKGITKRPTSNCKMH